MALDVISVQNMRESDRLTIEGGISSLELMQRAAQGIFDSVDKHHGWSGKTVIVIGSGNNGGDGSALSVILKNKGYDVTIQTLSDHFSKDNSYYLGKARDIGIEVITSDVISEADIIVDCILGTGFRGEPTGGPRTLIDEINKHKAANGTYVVSADINSGLNGDTGEYIVAVESDLTVVIGCHKKGIMEARDTSIVNQIDLALIGINAAYKEDYLLSDEEWNIKGFPADNTITKIEVEGVTYYR